MFFGAQKAEDWENWPSGVSLVLEPKYDGYRLTIVISSSGVVSYHCGKTEEPGWAENCTHIGEVLLALGFRNVMFDGELMALDWGTTASLVRRKRSLMDEAMKERLRTELRFHCFDMVDLADVSSVILPGKRRSVHVHPKALRVRYAALQKALEAYSGSIVTLVPQVAVSNEEELMASYAQMRSLGYEGGMAKDLDGPYVFDRSCYWRKLKPWKDTELIVEGAVEGEGKHKGRLGAFSCRTVIGGAEASCGGGFTNKQRQDYWDLWLANPAAIIGLRIEVTVQDSEVSATRHCNFRRERPQDC